MAQDDLIIGFQADTNKFQMDVEKAFKVVTNFADKSGDAGKSIEQSFKKLSQAAYNSGGEIQKAFNSLNISSDFTMKLQQDQLQRAKQFFQSQFEAIAKDANTSVADTMRAFEAFKNIESKLNLQTPQGKASSEANAKVIAEREATEARMIEINKLRAASVNAEVQKMLAAEKAATQKVIAEREATAQINILHEQALRMDVERNAAMVISREQSLRKMTLAHAEAAKINGMYDKGLVDGTGEAIKGIEGMTRGMTGFSFASVAAIAKVQIMYSIINKIMSAIGSAPGVAVDAIENYKSSIISNAAMITSMQVGVKDIGKEYQNNKIYAEAVQKVLIKMDAETAASGKNLIDMNNQFMQQGVLLDTNNKKQVDGFKNIANALAAITANDPNKDMQYAQEVRSMRDFSDRPGNRLVQYLKSQGVTKEMVEDWKKIGESTNNYGYLLEQLNPYFKGFAAAQGDINDLWETGKSTLITIRDDILRGGLSEGFSHIIALMKELNVWAEENKFKIQAMIKDGFSQIENTAKHLWDMRGAFVAMGGTALYGAILLGIGSVIIKVIELAKAIGTMNAAANAGMLAKVLTNPVAAVGAIVVGTTALAINDSMDRKKAEVEANKIGAFTKQDILPGHVAEIRKKYGPISAQEIMGKFANSELQLETVLGDSSEYIGQRIVFNEAAIAAAKAPYPKGIKTAGGKDAKGATVDVSTYNAIIGQFNTLQVKAEPDEYKRKMLEIETQFSELSNKFEQESNKAGLARQGITEKRIAELKQENIARLNLAETEKQAKEELAIFGAAEMAAMGQLKESNQIKLDLALNAQKAEIEITKDQIQLLKDNRREFQATDWMYGVTSGLESYSDSVARLGDQMKSFTEGALKGMEDAFVKFAMTGKLSFHDMANSIISDMLRITIRQTITGPLSNMISGGLTSIFGGARAEGGPVYGGTTYLVGEQGPELFTPGGSGMITPNHALGGATNLTVNVVNQSGQPVKARQGGTSFDGATMIKTIILEALDTDPGFRGAVRG